MRQPNDRNTPTQTATVSRPGPEMEKLGFLIGTWNASDTYEKSGLRPTADSDQVFTTPLPARAASRS